MNIGIQKFLSHNLIQWVVAIYLQVLDAFERFAMPVLLLIMRLWMASIFWYSGLTKISNWQATLSLFQYEYKVPIIPPEIAAILSSTVELSCPILLTIGLATRLAAFPMLCMAMVIQLTYSQMNEHYYWGMLLCTILFHGPGCLSLDHFIRRVFSIGNNGNNGS